MKHGEKDRAEDDPKIIRSEVRSNLIDFVDAIKEVIGVEKLDTDWEADVIEFFGVDETKLISIETKFPMYQQSQACYAINKFLEKKTKVIKIVSYEGEMRSAPNYQEIEVKRETTMPLLVRAWVFTKWRKTKLVVYIQFNGNYAEFSIFGIKKKNKVIHEFSSEVKKWMKINNFFRGERLEYLPYARIGFLDYNKNIDWEAVILPKELKDDVVLNIIFPLSNEKLCIRHNIPWRRGVLLTGIAGTGKTQLARVLCNALDNKVTMIWASPKALHDVEKVKLLFDASRYFAPTLLIIEDIDFVGKSRDYVTDPIVGELLTQLDGNAPNHGLFVIATSNRPELLDKALIERPSRFDVKLIFEVPDKEHRLKMVKHFSIGKQFKEEVTPNMIADMTAGMTGAYIKEVITYGMLLSLKQGKTIIEKEHLMKAIRQIKRKLEQRDIVR